MRCGWLVPRGWWGHDVTWLWWGVLGQDGRRRLVEGGRLWSLAGALTAQRHLPEAWGQLITHVILLRRRNRQDDLRAGGAGV